MTNLDPGRQPKPPGPPPKPPAGSLYAKHEPVCPRPVDGRFRRIKWAVMIVTLAIYYGTPWIRWNRGPYSPHQAVLIDLAHRRFYMFAIEIWPQEFYFVAGLLIMAGIGLFLVTSVVGRAWCGYACPQTVWTDLFQHIDRLIDGDRNAQLRLRAAPWTAGKIGRRLAKWSIYLAISFETGGAWITYFTDAPTLTHDFWIGQAAPVAYVTAAVLTFTTFALGGFMREQVCIYMCPWPRIQSAMLDEKSLTVTYKDWRGEPRGSVKAAKNASTPLGDCIDCGLCTAVCPTGIDIREGSQIGCITCALCVDACDEVMRKLDRPRGLIDYATLEDSEREIAGQPPTPHHKLIWHPRTLVYLTLWLSIGAVMLFALGTRKHLALSVAEDRDPPYMLLADGELRNGYTIKLRNMEDRPRHVVVALQNMPGARMWSDDMARSAAQRTLSLDLDADQTAPLRIYVVAPAHTAPQPLVLTATALDAEGGTASYSTRFAAPEAP